GSNKSAQARPQPYLLLSDSQILAGAPLSQFIDNFADVLRSRAIGDQDYVVGFDGHDIFHPEQNHQTISSPRENTVCSDGEYLAHRHVAAVTAQRFPQPLPASDIMPIETRSHPQHVPALLGNYPIERIELERAIALLKLRCLH